MAPAVVWPYQKRQSVSSPAPTMKSERGCCIMQDRYFSLWLSLICMRGFIFVVFFFAFLSIVPTVHAEPLWLTLPATPTLPAVKRSGAAPVNGVKIWYAEFGQGDPVVLLHGGLANANYWGNLVPVLAKSHQVIVMDSRGHGRSSRDGKPFGYDLMASDVLGLMDFLTIPKAAIIGWSDGAIVGLHIAIDHPDRITRLFAFAANSNPSGLKDTSQSPVFNRFIARAGREYEQLSATPDQYKPFLDEITKMWETQPDFTAKKLQSIKVPAWIVDGDHDEAIKRENTEFMAKEIPAAKLLLEPDVSHFSFIQNPQQFNADVLRFLKQAKDE
jgi:pimeloyl-ACP methyl ester carboxylesterase